MKLSEFDYNLPKDRIAQYPEKNRDSSKLLVIDRKQKKFEHRTFRDLNDLLYPGDVLVINNTRVIPARVHGRKPSGGKVEVLLIKELRTNTWEALIKGLHEGVVNFKQEISGYVSRRNGVATVTFSPLERKPGQDLLTGFTGDDIKNKLNKIGVMPLPPYIKRPADDLDTKCYQTVYAEKEGAVAAPTAGLHFTEELLERLKQKGIKIAKLTLHVGRGTFKPVLSPEIENHLMDEEHYEIPEDTADIINNAKLNGKRIIAVGTTVSRTLESSAMNSSLSIASASTGKASIFIYPGYKFRVIDTLITNFHLPRSTPLMLTSAFSGLPLLKKAYGEALNSGYRFFSYGDAMIII